MSYRQPVVMDFEDFAEAMADEMFDLELEYKAEFLAAAFPLLIETLGSWQAFHAIGGFDAFEGAAANEFYADLWSMVPLSRGGGGKTLEAEIKWNEMITALREDYQGLEAKLRQHIDRQRREATESKTRQPEQGAERDAQTG